MAVDASVQIEGVDRATLTPVVRRALGSETAEVVDWQCTSIHAPFNPATGGVFRVSGTARDRGQERHWSVVLKAGAANLLGNDVDDPQYWKREFLAYQSGFLDSLPSGLKAPRCFGADELPDRRFRLWLEDVEDAHPGKWPPELHVLAARQLGQLSGAYLTGIPIPDHFWLSRSSLHKTTVFMGQGTSLLPGIAHHSLVEQGYPEDTLARVMSLWADHEDLERALEHLPQTICHGDAFRRNLIVRQVGGHDEVVGVDWAFLGRGAIGEELDDLLPGSVWSRDLAPSEALELRDAVFEEYLAGLRDSGWSGDSRLVRLGYTVGVALRWGLRLTPLVVTIDSWYEVFDRMLTHAFGETVEEYLARQGRYAPLWLDFADEARELLPLVG